MGHIYLSHPIAIYACPIPWDSYYIIIILIWNTIQLNIYLSHPIAIYACPIPWDSYYIIIILIWNTIQLKLLDL